MGGLTPSSGPAAADGATEGHAGAARPEDLPRLFIEAWNKKGPDALASLFDSPAEFVNVTGLWWHDRTSIRKAHAYGLERIFNASQLSDDVAIVQAALTLSGQTAIAAIRQPGARKTIFSFVVHRVAGGWTWASAHNTDAVPNIETNVIGDERSVSGGQLPHRPGVLMSVAAAFSATSMPARILAAIYAGISTARPVICPAFSFA